MTAKKPAPKTEKEESATIRFNFCTKVKASIDLGVPLSAIEANLDLLGPHNRKDEARCVSKRTISMIKELSKDIRVKITPRSLPNLLRRLKLTASIQHLQNSRDQLVSGISKFQEAFTKALDSINGALNQINLTMESTWQDLQEQNQFPSNPISKKVS